jgi:hypothetical protein
MPTAAPTVAPAAALADSAFAGFGSARFGDAADAVRRAWARPLQATPAAPGATCHYLVMDSPPAGKRGIAFMLEDGSFVRYDVDDPGYPAPGGIRVGDPVEKILEAYAGRVAVQPDKYLAGARTLSVGDPAQPEVRLVFQVDADGKIVAWRLGRRPPVDYVEGCG